MTGFELLTTDEMAAADKRAVVLGVPSLTLMENAGRAVADASWQRLKRGDKVLVACGPGNNGGDGFVAARHLKAHGCEVVVLCLVPVAALEGDAAEMARRWGEAVGSCSGGIDLAGFTVVIDALFGAGLSRDIDGAAAVLIEALNLRSKGVSVVSVDIPSGIDGNTGALRGEAVRADATVTFFRRKPGHLLLPGRTHCGDVSVVDIGIPIAALPAAVKTWVNAADDASQWIAQWPQPSRDAHKYTRGHAVVVSGPAFASGAARMGARAALRIGAGLVTVASPASALPENAAHLTAIMLEPCEGARALGEMLSDKRKTAVLIGPGAGVGAATGDMVLTALCAGAGLVLDADALTSFAHRSDAGEASVGFGFTSRREDAQTGATALFEAIRADAARPVVMTPHEGEFKRLFADLAALPSKLERARRAAERSGAVVVLKGADTVIAAPDGRAAINANAPAWLATAGSGDVLAGFVTGLLAQGMAAFEAASAAVWLHGDCANLVGPGLIAEDLPEVLPQVLRRLHELCTPTG